MSRSRKHAIVFKESANPKSRKWYKRAASKAVRRIKWFDANGKRYKKLYNSWSICDWASRCFTRKSIQKALEFYPLYKLDQK